MLLGGPVLRLWAITGDEGGVAPVLEVEAVDFFVADGLEGGVGEGEGSDAGGIEESVADDAVFVQLDDADAGDGSGDGKQFAIWRELDGRGAASGIDQGMDLVDGAGGAGFERDIDDVGIAGQAGDAITGEAHPDGGLSETGWWLRQRDPAGELARGEIDDADAFGGRVDGEAAACGGGEGDLPRHPADAGEAGWQGDGSGADDAQAAEGQ